MSGSVYNINNYFENENYKGSMREHIAEVKGQTGYTLSDLLSCYLSKKEMEEIKAARKSAELEFEYTSGSDRTEGLDDSKAENLEEMALRDIFIKRNELRNGQVVDCSNIPLTGFNRIRGFFTDEYGKNFLREQQARKLLQLEIPGEEDGTIMHKIEALQRRETERTSQVTVEQNTNWFRGSPESEYSLSTAQKEEEKPYQRIRRADNPKYKAARETIKQEEHSL